MNWVDNPDRPGLARGHALAHSLLARVRTWLIAHIRAVAAVIVVLLAAVLLRHGISGLA